MPELCSASAVSEHTEDKATSLGRASSVRKANTVAAIAKNVPYLQPLAWNAAWPNHSVNRSANGRPPSPGRWYAVHFHRPGLGVLPSSPGYLER